MPKEPLGLEPPKLLQIKNLAGEFHRVSAVDYSPSTRELAEDIVSKLRRVSLKTDCISLREIDECYSDEDLRPVRERHQKHLDSCARCRDLLESQIHLFGP